MVVDVPAAVQSRLRDGEQVEWCGRPRQGFFLRGRDVLFLVTGAGAAALGTWCFVTLTVMRRSLDLPAVLGVVFCVYGHFLLWGRFIFDRSTRKGLFYAVTDQRCMVVSTRFRRVGRTLPRRHPDFRLEMYGNGLGTVWIDPKWKYSSRRSIYQWMSCFEQITDAEAVFALVRSEVPLSSTDHGIDPLLSAARQTRKSPDQRPGLS